MQGVEATRRSTRTRKGTKHALPGEEVSLTQKSGKQRKQHKQNQQGRQYTGYNESTPALHESHESPFSGQGNSVDLGQELDKMKNSLEFETSKMSALETLLGKVREAQPNKQRRVDFIDAVHQVGDPMEGTSELLDMPQHQ